MAHLPLVEAPQWEIVHRVVFQTLWIAGEGCRDQILSSFGREGERGEEVDSSNLALLVQFEKHASFYFSVMPS